MEKPDCLHKNTKIKVLNAVCGCETTVTICIDCEKELSEPKTDC